MTTLIAKQPAKIGHGGARRRNRARPVQPEPNKPDRYEYGWREITRITDEGQVVRERQPLTLWDILHPQEGDFRVHTDEHETFCGYLLDVFRAQVDGIAGAFVLHDTRVAWSKTSDIEAHGPDIAVIFNVREYDNWATFDENKENTRPSLIVEIVSPKTRKVDVEYKLDEYAQVGVEYYVIVDAHIRRRRTHYSLLGYRLINGAYRPLVANQQGWLWLEPVTLWIGLEDNWLVCFDEKGNAIGDYVEVTEARKVAEDRAEQAQRQAEQAQREAEQAQRQAEQAQYQTEQAQRQAEQAQRQAEQADLRALSERQARYDLEKRLQAAEEELHRLRDERG